MPPRTKTNPRDFTGTAKARLIEENAEEMASRRDSLAMRHQAEKEGLDVAIGPDVAGVQVVAEDEGPRVIEPEWVDIKLVCDLDHVTFGQTAQDMSFKEGQRYTVPRPFADHLERLGYVWQRLRVGQD